MQCIDYIFKIIDFFPSFGWAIIFLLLMSQYLLTNFLLQKKKQGHLSDQLSSHHFFFFAKGISHIPIHFFHQRNAQKKNFYWNLLQAFNLFKNSCKNSCKNSLLTKEKYNCKNCSVNSITSSSKLKQISKHQCIGLLYFLKSCLNFIRLQFNFPFIIMLS